MSRTRHTTPDESSLNTRQRIILNTLRGGSRTSYGLSLDAGFVPEPSIRRNIGELRQRGFNIVNQSGLYRLL